MSEIQRICAQCGKSSALDARYCPHCGYDTQAGLPAPRNTLPANIGKAALPILAGVASLALRAGWKLLQSRLAEATANNALIKPQPMQPTPRNDPQTTRRPRRIIRIRSSWAMGDASGIWRQGSSEHTIELDE